MISWFISFQLSETEWNLFLEHCYSHLSANDIVFYWKNTTYYIIHFYAILGECGDETYWWNVSSVRRCSEWKQTLTRPSIQRGGSFHAHVQVYKATVQRLLHLSHGAISMWYKRHEIDDRWVFAEEKLAICSQALQRVAYVFWIMWRFSLGDDKLKTKFQEISRKVWITGAGWIMKNSFLQWLNHKYLLRFNWSSFTSECLYGTTMR